MNNKQCTACREIKLCDEFYLLKGKYRSECKKCTIIRNGTYQKKMKSWKNQDSKHKIYMKKYYVENKQKFLEYREKFKKNNPDYHKKNGIVNEKKMENNQVLQINQIHFLNSKQNCPIKGNSYNNKGTLTNK